MTLLGGFNWLDGLLVFMLFASLTIGYGQGLLRQSMGLAALYIGAILGAQYHTVLANGIRYVFYGVPPRFVNGLAFFIILVLVTALVSWLAFDAYQATKISLFPVVDHLGGSVVGLLTALVTISLCLPVLSFTALEVWPTAEPARLFINEALDGSRMLVVFETLKPVLLSALIPWLPGGLPSIFNL